ncbi:MAG: hypothetical protein KKC84_03800 [Candidatus Omnitrophica bacterium]|nr:hypothetical protein [Candidatus Omnitrophota bacterium]
MYSKRAKSFVTIMLVIAITTLLVRIALDKLIKYNVAQNDSFAQVSLKRIAASLENYAKDHNGIYPVSMELLQKDSPPYLDQDYTAVPSYKGFQYSCSRLEETGYSCACAPSVCAVTGKTVYSVSTAGILVSEPCNQEGVR